MSHQQQGRGGRGGRGERGGGRPQEPPLPKPYAFIPLPSQHPGLQKPAGHHRYQPGTLTGTLTAQIVARSPIHVASGLLEPLRNRDYPLVKGHFRTNDTLAIPATSLKGCIRSILEAIAPAAITITRARPLPNEANPSNNLDRLDVAQRLFGTLGYQGCVRFRDALIEPADARPAIVPSVQLFRPRSDAHDTYFDGRRPKGRKFYMHGTVATGNLPLETCPVDSTFRLQLDFDNLTRGEVGLLLYALGLGAPRLWPKLGGSKPACLGTIEVSNPALVVLEPSAAYTDFDATPQPQVIEPLLKAAETEELVLRNQLQQLADVLRWPREDRDCPHRNY